MNMKNKLFLLIATSLLLVGCGAKKQPNPEPNPEPDPVLPTGVDTKKFTFLNNTDVFPTGDLTKATSMEKFVAGFNKDGEFVTSASVVGKVQMASMNSDTCYIKSILQFGSQSSAGELRINFAVDIMDVTIETQAFWKSYNSGGEVVTNVDTNAHLYVDKDAQDIDLTAEAGKEPDKHTATFETPNKSVKLYTKEENQRAYIHSITIRYRI